MTLFWSLAALLAFELAAAQPLFRWDTAVGSCTHTCGSRGVRESLILCRGPSGPSDFVEEIICDPFTKPSRPPPEPCNRKACPSPYKWSIIVGSCTHTCGQEGIVPSLIICFGLSRTVDEVFCDPNTRPPYPAPEECNRLPCPVPPGFVTPGPLCQIHPIPCENLDISLGQNAVIKGGQRLVIVAQLQPGAEPAPSFVWTLPSGETLRAGERAANVRVDAAGTRLTVTGIATGDAGLYIATASNTVGSATLSSTITVERFSWRVIVGSCTRICGTDGITPSLILCEDNWGDAVDEINCCAQKPATPLPEPCNRITCPDPPLIKVPPSLVQNPPIRVGNVAIGAGQNIQIHAGNSLRIETNLAKPGIPPATFSWSLPGGETVNSGEMSGQFQVHENGTLAITNIEWNHRGDYGVRAWNGGGSDSITSSVTVLTGPKFFDSPRLATIDIEIGQNVTITEGSRLVIRARVVQGAPDPVLLWTLPDGSTPKERLGRFSVTKSGALVVKHIKLADRGRYTATATNSVGEVAVVSRVTVI